MRLLFFFLDGVGLGVDDPEVNPFARVKMPNLQSVLGGERLVIDSFSRISKRSQGDSLMLETERATLLALDARLDVAGLPQSATGQATLLTGINVPAEIGYHYGPKPNQEVAAFLRNGNLFSTLMEEGYKTALLNAYPPVYFASIQSGRRIYSVIPLAVTSAGLTLKTIDDLKAGQALSADFTAQGWRDRLNLSEISLLAPKQAGERMAMLGMSYDLAFFEYWVSDYAGHSQDMRVAQDMLETLDQVLGGLLEAWNDDEGLTLITSDHGNLEDMTTRRHTANLVPALLIGDRKLRRDFVKGLTDISGVTPAILKLLREG
jgi:2,3-bisphosphoglycerate-independent phosphoglycerate mutase